MNSGRYWLTGSAEKDLADIAEYTLETWGGPLYILHRRVILYLHNLPQQARHANDTGLNVHMI